MAELYRQIAALVTNGTLKGDNVMTALKMGTDAVLTDAARKTAWKPVRDVVTAEANKLAQMGAAESAYATLFLECADGYDASSPSRELSPELKALILQIIQLILSLLLK